MGLLHTTIVTVLVLAYFTEDCLTKRIRRANSDTFNVLLELYKVKPLRDSNVFKSFANTILLPSNDGGLHFDSKESDPDTVRLIEEPIHVPTVADDNPSPYFARIDRPENFFDTLNGVIRQKKIIFEEATERQRTNSTITTTEVSKLSFIDDNDNKAEIFIDNPNKPLIQKDKQATKEQNTDATTTATSVGDLLKQISFVEDHDIEAEIFIDDPKKQLGTNNGRATEKQQSDVNATTLSHGDIATKISFVAENDDMTETFIDHKKLIEKDDKDENEMNTFSKEVIAI